MDTAFHQFLEFANLLLAFLSVGGGVGGVLLFLLIRFVKSGEDKNVNKRKTTRTKQNTR